MDRLTVVCWKWKPQPDYRSQFGPETVNVLKNMVARHYRRPHDFVCVTDDPEGIDRSIRIVPLWKDHADIPNPTSRRNPSCYRRLRAFSAEAADLFGPRFVSLDLDCVITGDLEPLWDRPEEFVIWGDTARRTPYNGGMFLLTAGSRRRVWDEFDPDCSPALTRSLGMIGSDQAWIAACLGPGEPRWTIDDGVYSFNNHIRRCGGKLPANARIVFFHGRADPWQTEVQSQYPWVKAHWQ